MRTVILYPPTGGRNRGTHGRGTAGLPARAIASVVMTLAVALPSIAKKGSLSYSLVEAHLLQPGPSWAEAVNDSGQLAGEASKGGDLVPVKWGPDPREIRRPPGMGTVILRGMSARGEVCGVALYPDRVGSKAILSSAGSFHLLSTPQRWGTTAYGMNSKGVIVGSASRVARRTEELPVSWTSYGMTYLQIPPGGSGSASAVNERGEIVGRVRVGAGTERPARWIARRLSLLPLPRGAVAGWARGVNQAGAIVGSARLPDGTLIGVLWKVGGVPLVVRPPSTTHVSRVVPIGIDDRGVVAGNFSYEIDGDWHGFAWLGGGATDLGGQLHTEGSLWVNGISPRGNIAVRLVRPAFLQGRMSEACELIPK